MRSSCRQTWNSTPAYICRLRMSVWTAIHLLHILLSISRQAHSGEGLTIYLGRTHDIICLVAATLKYMVERSLSKGVLFQFEDGRALTRERFVTAVREALTTTGVDSSKYCGHSFRIGAATMAAERGVQDSLIRTMGRWKSSTYLLYICTPRDTICSVARTLLGGHRSVS